MVRDSFLNPAVACTPVQLAIAAVTAYVFPFPPFVLPFTLPRTLVVDVRADFGQPYWVSFSVVRQWLSS
jgi:hypothetical protein